MVAATAGATTVGWTVRYRRVCQPRQSTQTTCRHVLPSGAVTGTAPKVIGTRLPAPRKQLGRPLECIEAWLSNQVTPPEIPYDHPATVTVALLIPV